MPNSPSCSGARAVVLRYPSMRAELIDYLRQLASPQLLWRDTGESAPLDGAVHFLFDDTSLASDPAQAIGYYLVDASEAELVRAVVESIDSVLHRYGTTSSDAFYLALREWRQIVERADVAWRALRARDPGSYELAPSE